MRALVTGGAGFIGSHVVDALLGAGARVSVLDSLDPRVHRVPPEIPPGVGFVRGDVRDDAALSRAIGEGIGVVFHEAAMVGYGTGEDAGEYDAVNVEGTRLLLRALARAPRPPSRVVLASTMALYGEGAYRCPSCREPRAGVRGDKDLAAGRWEPACPVCGTTLVAQATTEGTPPRPGTAYARSKLEQERLAFAEGRRLGVPVVALRYHNVYGARTPRNTPYAGVASLFKSRLLAGEPPLLFEDGGQLRDFVHVSDVARANLLAASAPEERVAFEAFNVGTGRPRSIGDLARELARSLDPGLAPRTTGGHRAGDARHVFASIAKAERVLGYRPLVAFEEGVAAFAREPMRAAVSAGSPGSRDRRSRSAGVSTS